MNRKRICFFNLILQNDSSIFCTSGIPPGLHEVIGPDNTSGKLVKANVSVNLFTWNQKQNTNKLTTFNGKSFCKIILRKIPPWDYTPKFVYNFQKTVSKDSKGKSHLKSSW